MLHHFSRSNGAAASVNKSARLMGTASALALGLVVAAPAWAQDEQGAEAAEDAIVVTGIRSRIESSQAIKRDADTFVDAITAEDIGALPDKSVNETLQRIPGVTITRFQGRDDPDHFSIEGSNVVIRGLNFVRGEFNGRDAFSVNTGRALGFNDISPELLGSVLVFKNSTADMIEGGISGTVNLRTRKPLDQKGLVVAGTIEGAYGDIRESLQPTYSILASNIFETGIGRIGVLASYGRSKLNSTAYGSQLADFVDRPDLANGVSGERFVPRGIGARSSEFERDRETYSGTLQWEAPDESAVVTLEYIRANADQKWGERVIEAELGAGGNPTNADFVFNDSGVLTSGTLTGGTDVYQYPVRQTDTRNSTEDFSANISLRPTERLRVSFDLQHARSKSRNLDLTVFGAISGNSLQNSSFAPLFPGAQPVIGAIGGENKGVPDVTNVLADGSDGADVLNNLSSYFYRAAMDHIEQSDGRENAFRADVEYDVSDLGFLRTLRAGGRYSDRKQTRRYTTYNWNNLSESWNDGGSGAGFNSSNLTRYSDTQGGLLSPEVFSFPNFQRGFNAAPTGAYPTVDLIESYRDGSLQAALLEANPNALWRPLDQRDGVIAGTPFLPGDINRSREETWAAYARADFQFDDIFGEGTYVNGNIGVRYVNTKFQTAGLVTTPNQATIFNGQSVAEVCGNTPAGQQAPSYCAFDAATLARFLAFSDNTTSEVNRKNDYDYFLPSININFHLSNQFLIRAAASRAISRPDFGRTAFTATIIPTNLNELPPEDRASVPIFSTETGGLNLEGIESTNLDLGFEYYPKPGSAITLNLFYKKLDNLLQLGSVAQEFTAGNGTVSDVLVRQPVNIGKGDVKGFEISGSHFFNDELPGALGGLGVEANYTYVKASDFQSVSARPRYVGITLPLDQLSKHTYNVALLYDKYGVNARVAYNWRSRYLLTQEDVINPFSPIFGAPTGQLDASIYYSLTENIKIGVQGNNLLDEVTVTEQQTAFVGTDGTNQPGPLAPRSYLRNDRRFSFGLRFNF